MEVKLKRGSSRETEYGGKQKTHDKSVNRIYNKILNCNWFSVHLFVT